MTFRAGEQDARIVAMPKAGGRPVTGTRLGVLDIGSNSGQLQIVDLRHEAPPLPAYAVKQPVRLGGELDGNGAPSQYSIQRVVAATSEALPAAEEHRVD